MIHVNQKVIQIRGGTHRAELFFTSLSGEHSWTFIHRGSVYHVRQVGYMVMDFVLLDKVKELVDSFDHTYSLWQEESDDLKTFIYKYNRRVAEIPVSPSAEGYALLLLYLIDKILQNTEHKNGEGNVRLSSVRVHETATGYAEAFREDLKLVNFNIHDIRFSEAIREEWKDELWWEEMKKDKN